ncbi:MAG: flagellin [Methanoregula sp.]|nr:flagellin [Methanoregula sp.]
MNSLKRNDEGFTGLEAAIVLIAFVVVAAVFSYVVLGAGFFTTQKAQETVYSGVAQATSNIQMTGQVYGLGSGPSPTLINEIQFSIGLAPGSPTIDLTMLKIVYSRPDLETAPIILTYGGGTASTTEFSSTIATVAAPSLAAQQQVLIDFKVVGTPKNKIMNIEIRPSVGASLPFSKSTPASIASTNVLY